MELGSWALISAPSIFGLLPLIIFVIWAFRGKDTLSGMLLGITVGAILLGLDLSALAKVFQDSLGSPPVLIAVIIMLGAGLGVLMTEAHVSHTLVYWIVKRIGVNTRTKAKISLAVCSILICGLLGTLAGGNAVIAPVILPIMATLGVTPTVVTALFKVSGEIGLILGPLTGVTLMTLEMTGLSYGQFMMQAAIPYAVVWFIGTWIGCNRAQKRTEGKESYELSDDVKDLSSIVITPQQIRTTVAFFITFIILIGYGIYSKQGTGYAVIVMIILAAVVAAFSHIKFERAVECVIQGAKSQVYMLLIGIAISILLTQVTAAGGFEALSDMINGVAKSGGPAGIMLLATLVGGFGIEASAVAEIQIITMMFGDLAKEVGLPMGCFALIILAATRLTGNTYPTVNFVGQMGIAQCTNTKEVLQALWFGSGLLVVFLVIMAFLGPVIYT
ncbi:TRAP transporter large permease subunit [Peribacillus muralis]|uniref:TRAP transporter large permease subunit n=1 Tax=Peribacillus muralis TaxID=264697 RepID=UPI001F4D5DC0|nr:TRAP transporter large permease subunit [Peribacillus muralis]MCK1995145.1 TRAP transporter large permease subunit [Peribacillus muralis]MCK2015772.1 TRAP transporter large permease subunit [Peribacillus muralis]